MSVQSNKKKEQQQRREKENSMAERKSALKRAPVRPELEALFEEARAYEMSEKELRAQRESFVYGNAPKGSGITKESAAVSVRNLRVSVCPA